MITLSAQHESTVGSVHSKVDGSLNVADTTVSAGSGDTVTVSVAVTVAVVPTVVVRSTVEVTVTGGAKAVVLRGTREVGASEKRGYQLAIVRTKKNVYALEMWGPLDTFNRDRAALDKAIASLRV